MINFTVFPYAVALLTREMNVCGRLEQQVLLIHRAHTGFGDNMYSLIGGKVTKNESPKDALIREVYEEVGAFVKAEDTIFSHVIYFKGIKNVHVSFIFTISRWSGEIANKEQEKHDHIQWFNKDSLPTNILFPHGQVINCIEHGIFYSEAGFQERVS